MNKAAMNMGVYLFKNPISILSVMYSEMVLLDQMIILSLILGRAIILFSVVTTAFGENVPALLNNFSIV